MFRTKASGLVAFGASLIGVSIANRQHDVYIDPTIGLMISIFVGLVSVIAHGTNRIVEAINQNKK